MPIAKLGEATLVLYGAGRRAKLIFKVCALGLQLPQPRHTSEAAPAATGAKQIRIVALRALACENISRALLKIRSGEKPAARNLTEALLAKSGL